MNRPDMVFPRMIRYKAAAFARPIKDVIGVSYRVKRKNLLPTALNGIDLFVAGGEILSAKKSDA